MKKNKKLGCLSLLLLSPITMAMQPLDDHSLSNTTGQDGLTVDVSISKIDFNQVAIIDKNGFTPNATTKAALVMAKSPGATAPIGVDFVEIFNANGTIQNSASQALKVVIDTDAGSGINGAFANLALSLGNQVNGLRIRPFSAYMVPDGSDAISSVLGSTYTQKSIFTTGTSLKNNITELLRSSSNIDIKFIAANKPTMNIQFGHSPQGQLIKFGGAIDSICGSTTAQPDGCSFNLVSGNTGAQFDAQITGKDANGFSLNGFYLSLVNDVTSGSENIPGGIVFGNEGVSDKLNISIKNLQLGEKGQSNANVFNGLQNGSMGNIGAVGVSATNLKVNVRGM